MASYLSQLKDLLRSGEGSQEFFDPKNDKEKTAEVQLKGVPQRPEGWPVELLDPVMLDDGEKSRSAHITDENNVSYMLFHDPENQGQYIALKSTDVYQMYEDHILPVRRAIEDDTKGFDVHHGKVVSRGSSSELRIINNVSEEVVKETTFQEGDVGRLAILDENGAIEKFGDGKLGDEQKVYLVDPKLEIGDVPVNPIESHQFKIEPYYHSPLDFKADKALSNNINEWADSVHFEDNSVNFGVGVSLAELTEGGLINVQEYEPAPKPEVEPQGPVPNITIEAVAERVVKPEPQVPSAQEFFNEKISGDHLNTLGGVEGQSGLVRSAERTFDLIERHFEKSPDLSDPKVQRQIDFTFNNPHGVGEGWKAVVADYIQERIETGEPLDGEKHKAAIQALVDGDVDTAKAHLDGTYVKPEVVEPELERQNLAVLGIQFPAMVTNLSDETMLTQAVMGAKSAIENGLLPDDQIEEIIAKVEKIEDAEKYSAGYADVLRDVAENPDGEYAQDIYEVQLARSEVLQGEFLATNLKDILDMTLTQRDASGAGCQTSMLEQTELYSAVLTMDGYFPDAVDVEAGTIDASMLPAGAREILKDDIDYINSKYQAGSQNDLTNIDECKGAFDAPNV